MEQKCLRCGICCNECRGIVSDAEIAMLEEISGDRDYSYGGEFPKFHEGNQWIFPCVFWTKEGGCSIYHIRPQMCRDFACPRWKNDGVISEEEYRKIWKG